MGTVTGAVHVSAMDFRPARSLIAIPRWVWMCALMLGIMMGSAGVATVVFTAWATAAGTLRVETLELLGILCVGVVLLVAGQTVLAGLSSEHHRIRPWLYLMPLPVGMMSASVIFLILHA